MKIRGWAIDGFGVFRDYRVDALPEPADGGHGDGFRIAEDVRGGLDAERRVERHGYRPEAQRADERVEELRAGRVDEADLVAGPDARGGQPGGVATALRPEPCVGDHLVVEGEVLRVGRERGPPADDVRERGGSLRVQTHS